MAQIRKLQTVLAEREESLKTVNLKNSRLESEAEGFSQRLRALDESEQRYKDENWSLETQTHEMHAAAREASDREQKLQQALTITTSEKSSAQRELDDLRQTYNKIIEHHATIRKGHESEVAGLQRNLSLGENDRGTLQRKVEELTSQNQELANAMAGRLRQDEIEPREDLGPETEDFSLDRLDSENSPPPSPTKGIARHSMLESETLKSSLNHANRMIQNLRSTNHREKTEKLELKRMLQEARDELEIRRRESGGSNIDNKRLKSKPNQDASKRPARTAMLGAERNSRTDVLLDDAAWEDHNGEASPKRAAVPRSLNVDSETSGGRFTDMSDAYQTANETEDAFETATENEAFQTGVESMAGDSSDENTETEGANIRRRTVRGPQALSLMTAKPGSRSSFISTASTSADDEEYQADTPIQAQPQRYRLKLNRASRRSRIGSESLADNSPSSTRNSPASFINPPSQGNQSLFAELGDLNGDESDEEVEGTPSKKSLISPRSTPVTRPLPVLQNEAVSNETPPIPRLPMVNSEMMTEDWEPSQSSSAITEDVSTGSAGNRILSTSKSTPKTRDIGVQRTPLSGSHLNSISTRNSTPPRTVWDQPLERFAGPIPTFGPALTSTPMSTTSSSSRDLQFGHRPEPISPSPLPSTLRLNLSPIQSLETIPVEPTPSLPLRDIRRQGGRVDPLLASSPDTARLARAGMTSRGNTGSVVGGVDPVNSRVTQNSEEKFARDQSVSPTSTKREGKLPLGEVPANIFQRGIGNKEKPQGAPKLALLDMTDQSSQTTLSSEQIDKIIKEKDNISGTRNVADGQKMAVAPILKPLSDIGAVSSPSRADRSQESLGGPRGKAADTGLAKEAAPLVKTPKRPGSSGSLRTSITAYPPLPPDHRQAIAAAAQKAPSVEAPPPVMGPPLAPASAYRVNTLRPRTPSEQRLQSPSSRIHNTSRTRYSTARSQVSRQSSVTSFASELNERFNIRVDGMPIPGGFEGATDPRMIQAITQTMIGEFLWKYTRKAGRGAMSNNRHQRFFWVHPYTRTLYWSDRDPSTAGRAELKAKSVAITGVRVVTDDNPMPPGLHRKSIVIITPGRSVQFTATTGQRHETWFNALSYLLLRTAPDGSILNGEGNTNLTAEDAADVAEFNPSYSRRGSRTVGSRTSLASFASQASRNPSAHRAPSSLSSRQQPAAADPGQSSASKQHRSLSSRFSNYWRPNSPPAARESFSSKRSQPGQQQETGSLYNGSAVHDSADDVRQVTERHEHDPDRLENVRACCDGKHFRACFNEAERNIGFATVRRLLTMRFVCREARCRITGQKRAAWLPYEQAFSSTCAGANELGEIFFWLFVPLPPPRVLYL